MRQQIRLIPNVLTRTGSRVLGLSNCGERITGVIVRSNDGADETIDGVHYRRMLALPHPMNFIWYFVELVPRALVASSSSA